MIGRLLPVATSALVNAFGAAATVLLIQGKHLVVACLLGGVTLIAVVWRARWRRPLHMTARALLISGSASVAVTRIDQAWVTVAATALLLIMVMEETALLRLPVQGHDAVNLAGAGRGRGQNLSATNLFRSNLALTAWFALTCWLRWSSWVFAVPVLLACVAAAALAALSVRDWRRRAAALSAFRRAIADYAPEFVLHFSGSPASLQHITMWLPHLVRIGRRFVVVVREPHTLDQLARITADVPVVLCESLAALEAAVVESLRAAFYVNNGTKNTQLVRFGQLYHVQLLHGDSDKPPSYSPVSALYDKVFVAGQAGRDRYSRHGVAIPDEKFTIVGRPQVEGVLERAAERSAFKTPRTVLYAPTWHGQYQDSNFCSLPIAEAIVTALLVAGARVIFRPHPFSRADERSAAQIAAVERLLIRDNGRNALGHQLEPTAGLSLVDSFNSSDALVADVSSVVSDYLFSGKPFAVSDMLDEGPLFVRTFPLASAAHVIPRSLDGLDGIVAKLLADDDCFSDERWQMRRYYLGDFPAEGYGEVFPQAARDVIDLPRKRSSGHEDTDDDHPDVGPPVAIRDEADEPEL